VNVAEYIIDRASARGVTAIFELSGGMITPLLDACGQRSEPRLVSMHHEQAAAFAADAYGRVSGVPGVAMATSGPGATNLLTGIASSYFDSSPTVFITGQVNRSEQRGSRGVRQLGFQETDIVSMAEPVTKRAFSVSSPDEIPGLIEEAFDLACGGRPGPVLVDVPMDVQRSDLPAGQSRETLPRVSIDTSVNENDWYGLRESLLQVQRPLVILGGGIRAAGVVAEARAFVERMHLPAVHTLMAVDVLSYEHFCRVGMLGSYGNRWANWAVAHSDCLIVLGSRLDVRQTGSAVDAFAQGKKIIHVDCDPHEINNRIVGCAPMLMDLRAFFDAARTRLKVDCKRATEPWFTEIHRRRVAYPDTEELNGITGINPNVLIRSLSEVSTQAQAYVVDVGQNQMWAAQSLRLTAEQRFLTSGGLGSMGFALPGAIGASFAGSQAPVVMIAGDGGMQCNIQELQTVVRENLPIKMVVLNNQSHGMVRQFQDEVFGGRHIATRSGYSAPDFVRVARSYGITGGSVSEAEGVPDALEALWHNPREAFLLEVAISVEANAYPKMTFGSGPDSMTPPK
jgi:acetolactate synthase-1/2/3 large subunit